MNLLKKELRLCLHPTALLMPLLSVLILTPNYPYSVTCFYVTLSIFFICLSGRENHDAAFTLSLPVSRKQVVRSRMLFACCLEIFQLMMCALFIWIKSLIGYTPNQAGLDAGIAIIGDGLILFALFNLVFFPLYYRDIAKVGRAFVISAIAVFIYISAGVVATYALPFVRDALDTEDPLFMKEKLLFIAASAAVYAGGTYAAFSLSVKRFGQLDLQL